MPEGCWSVVSTSPPSPPRCNKARIHDSDQFRPVFRRGNGPPVLDSAIGLLDPGQTRVCRCVNETRFLHGRKFCPVRRCNGKERTGVACHCSCCTRVGRIVNVSILYHSSKFRPVVATWFQVTPKSTDV